MSVQVVPSLWTVQDVATYLGVPVETVYAWRKKRTGPPGARVGKHLRFDPEAVRTWFSQQCNTYRKE